MNEPPLDVNAPAAFLRRGVMLRRVEPGTVPPAAAMDGRQRFRFEGSAFPADDPPPLSLVGRVMSGLGALLPKAHPSEPGFDHSERGSLTIDLLAPQKEVESAERRLHANDGEMDWEVLPATVLAAETVGALLAAEPSLAAAQANAIGGTFAEHLERFGRSLGEVGVTSVIQESAADHVPRRRAEREQIAAVVKQLERTEPLKDQVIDVTGVLQTLSSRGTDEFGSWVLETFENLPLPRELVGGRPGMTISGGLTSETFAALRDGAYWEHNVVATIALHRVQQGARQRRVGVTLLAIRHVK